MEGRVSQEQCEQNEIAKLTQMKSKVNRLRRSPKAVTPKLGQNRNTVDFKTPTRPARGQFRRLIPDDSPSNDPDSHQDIIWDTTSPSPIRHGRGQRRAANVKAVDISDIANRIAPKSGKLDADSSLLQWIGDSAVPCTPEVQQPRVKTVATKQSTVEDLMRLAKQFDFNMRQDEAQDADSRHEVKQEPADDHRFTADHNKSAAVHPVEAGLQPEMDDDLDFLFDGPTQQLSGRLSQPSSCRTQEAPARNLDVGTASDSQKGSSSLTKANTDLDDDWSSDGLLDDSLLLEMTQNPDLFAAPQCSSTQKLNRNAFGAVTKKPQEGKNDGVFPKQNTRSEQSFHMDSQTQARTENYKVNYCTNKVFPVSKASSVSQSGFNANQNQLCQPKTQPNYQPNTKHLNIVKPPCPKPPSMHQNTNSGGHKQREEDVITAQDVLDEDLDSFFASDDIWDEEDDDLFCEACDNIEEETTTKASQNQTCGTSGAAGQQTVFAHPHPPKRASANVSMSSANTSASQYGLKAPAVHSGPNVSCDPTRPSGPSSNGPYKFKQVRSSTLVGRGTYADPSQSQLGHERGVLAVLQSDVSAQDNQQFKQPYIDSFRTAQVLAKDVCNSGVVRCSDAEIEKKKQQAMERRRLRLMANQNLRAPV